MQSKCGFGNAEFDHFATALCTQAAHSAECLENFVRLSECIIQNECPQHDGSAFKISALPCAREYYEFYECGDGAVSFSCTDHTQSAKLPH